MSQFSHIEYSELLDMLASSTTQYTHLLSENNRNEEFYRCKRNIELLTIELESRRYQETGKVNPPIDHDSQRYI